MRHVTVGSVLELEMFQDSPPELISQAADSANDKPVRWMHILETARPEGLLPGGEFILTTATFLDSVVRDEAAGIEAANQFLDTVEFTGAVAVVAEVLPDRPRVIAALKTAAQHRSTPIYVLYNRIRFVELTQFVHENIAAARLQEVETDRRIHEAFTRLSVGSASTSRIVAEATALLGYPVEWESVERHGSDMVDDAHTVIAGDEVLGRLVVRERGRADERLVQTVLERAGQAVAISVLALRSQREMRRSMASSLFYQIRSGTELSDQEVQWRLTETFGYAPISATLWAPVVFRISGRQQDEEDLNHWSGILLEILEQLGSVQKAPVFAARSEIGVVDVLAPSRRQNELHALIENTQTRFTSRLRNQAQLVAGIATGCTSAKAAAELLTNASQIAQAGEAYLATTDQRRSYFYARDLGLAGLLATLKDNDHVRNFIVTELSNLHAHYGSRRSFEAQLEFIEAIIGSDNKAEIARELHISRPALYARIKRLETQLGYQLEAHPKRRTATHLAILAYHLAPDQTYTLLSNRHK